MKTKELTELSQSVLMNTYNRFPIVLRKGRGVRVWDTDGKEYLDFVGGIATNVLGHCHPSVVMALQKQAQRLIHVSNFYHIEPQTRLGALLVEHSFADRVFFCNSGTEANEAAIKLARKYSAENHAPGRHEIITTLKSFHGRTLGALAATGQERLKRGFEPMMPGFKHVPFNDPETLRMAVGERTCAVLMEPILGEGGVRLPSPDYLKRVREICDQNNLLLIFDEVQTGMGRTGKLFAYEHYGITPDIMTLAKGLGGGVPIGAVLATEKVSTAFGYSDHGSTFGGNPLACASGLATLNTVLEDGLLLEQCTRVGKKLLEGLEELRGRFSKVVVEVRGLGFLAAMELTRECAPVVAECLKRGLLVNCTAGNVLRFMPPLITREREVREMLKTLALAMEKST